MQLRVRHVLLFGVVILCRLANVVQSLAPADGHNGVHRRDVLAGAAASLLGPTAANAAAAAAPIAVIGASGRTGALCVASCLARGLPVRALTRSGEWQIPDTAETDNAAMNNDNVKSLLTVQACDARNRAALNAGVAGCRGVIYAASASKKGGQANEIDNLAAVAAAQACIDAGVGRYVLISSTATTRPKSLGYLFTNVYQNIMAEKRLGELGVMAEYGKKSPSAATGSYTIIRPGGLEEPKRNVVLGPSALELSQGDALAGVVSRADLAQVAVETALSQASNLQNTSFEVYYTESAQPCEGRFKSFLQGDKVPRLHGDSYEALFQGLQRDGEYYVPP